MIHRAGMAVFLVSTLAGSALAGESAASAAAAFQAFWARAEGRPFDVQAALWDRMIEAPRRALYDAAVWETRDHPDGGARKARLLRQRFDAYRRLAARIPAEERALEQALPGTQARFKALFPDAPARPPVHLVLAPGFDAKSAVGPDGVPVLLLAVDSLALEEADLGVLLPHELFHLYHARRAGVLNDGVMPGATLLLPLFAEGIATFVSATLAPDRTEGQWLLQEDLGALLLDRLPELSRHFLADADRLAADPAHPEAFRRWFNASPAGSRGDLPDRTGYWLGLQVIRHLARAHTLQEMAAWPPARAEAEARGALRALAGLPQTVP
ncbi:hypothetical protein [Geothrix paludis]|uniref:hypothetical protein n=1 Tax=Geothrix paludis TaxID=2922722 RepID=UPI001FAB4188|nr:hypothetical protein [Geothrix paludis]